MKRGVNMPKNRLLSALIILSVLCISQQALGEVSTIGIWETGAFHNKELGDDRLLVVIAHADFTWYGTVGLSSMTYGGQAMAKGTSDLMKSCH